MLGGLLRLVGSTNGNVCHHPNGPRRRIRLVLEQGCEGVVAVLLHARLWVESKSAFGPGARARLVAFLLRNEIQLTAKSWYKINQDAINIGLTGLRL
jgi:hypothetical protein